MTERERLTERIGDGIRYYDGKYLQTCYPKNNNLRPLDKLAVKLCELEDKIENGTLVELPCKVGQTIYYIHKGTIKTDTVSRLTITAKGINNILSRHKVSFWKHYQWFLTKEEAEKALAERSNNGDIH